MQAAFREGARDGRAAGWRALAASVRAGPRLTARTSGETVDTAALGGVVASTGHRGELTRPPHGAGRARDLLRRKLQGLVSRLWPRRLETTEAVGGASDLRFGLDESRRIREMRMDGARGKDLVSQIPNRRLELAQRHPPGSHGSLRNSAEHGVQGVFPCGRGRHRRISAGSAPLVSANVQMSFSRLRVWRSRPAQAAPFEAARAPAMPQVEECILLLTSAGRTFTAPQ